MGIIVLLIAVIFLSSHCSGNGSKGTRGGVAGSVNGGSGGEVSQTPAGYDDVSVTGGASEDVSGNIGGASSGNVDGGTNGYAPGNIGNTGGVPGPDTSSGSGIPIAPYANSGEPVLETGFSDQQIAAIAATSDPLSFPYRMFDTEGDGKVHSMIAGDYDRSGTLDWYDLSMLLQMLCPASPKTDAFGPFCGSLYIPPGTWKSLSDAQAVSGSLGYYGSPARSADSGPHGWNWDSIFVNHDLNPIHRLRIIGSGIDKTILTMQLSRESYCKWHGTTGGGGIWLYRHDTHGPGPHIEVAGLTFQGLPGRRTNSKNSCVSDLAVTPDAAYAAGGAQRVTQNAIGIYGTTTNGRYIEPVLTTSPNLYIHDIVINGADYQGIVIAAYDGVQVRNVSVSNVGTSGLSLYSTKNAEASDVTIAQCTSSIPEGAFHIEAQSDNYNGPGSNTEMGPSKNTTVTNLSITGCFRGLDINALGSGGIDNVSINNLFIDDIGLRDVSPWKWNPQHATAVEFSDRACLYGLPDVATPCYITNVAIRGGTLGTISRGIAGLAIDGITNVATGLTDSPHNWTFQDLRIANAGARLTSAMAIVEGGAAPGYPSGLQFVNNVLQGSNSNLTSLLALSNANAAVISGNSFFGTLGGTWAAQLYSVNSSSIFYRNNTFELGGGPNTSALVLHTGDRGNAVIGNRIRASSGFASIYVDAGSGGHRIASNTLTGPTTYGLAVAAGLGTVIEGNVINGSKIHISADQTRIYNNTIHGSPTFGIQDLAGSDFRNNIVSSAGAVSLNVAEGKTATGATNWFTGAIWGTYSDIQGRDPANQDDPLFLDAANGNFRLQPGSPCIGSGTWPATATSIFGNEGVCWPNARPLNIGAYCWTWNP
jgi:hypothetical protein